MDDPLVPLLLVEDEPDLREALEEYLSAFGFAVVSVETAKEALACAVRLPPRILLTDLSLPDSRGDLFLEQFHQSHPTCLLYVHSGDSSFEPSPQLRAAGLTEAHVFSKPTDLGSMVQQLQADLRL